MYQVNRFFPVLSKNNSKNAGCIDLSPLSYRCHARHLTCIVSAACCCVMPDDVLASLTSSGVGASIYYPCVKFVSLCNAQYHGVTRCVTVLLASADISY